MARRGPVSPLSVQLSCKPRRPMLGLSRINYLRSRFLRCAAGAFLFDSIFARMGLNPDNVFQMLNLLDQTVDVLTDAAVEAGRKCA